VLETSLTRGGFIV